MNLHEEAVIKAFVVPSPQERFLNSLEAQIWRCGQPEKSSASEAPARHETETKPDVPPGTPPPPTGGSGGNAPSGKGGVAGGQADYATVTKLGETSGKPAGAPPSGPEHAKTGRHDEVAKTARDDEVAKTARHDEVGKTGCDDLAKTGTVGTSAKSDSDKSNKSDSAKKSGGNTGVSEGDAKLHKDAHEEAQRVANYKPPTFKAGPGDGKVISPHAAPRWPGERNHESRRFLQPFVSPGSVEQRDRSEGRVLGRIHGQRYSSN